MVDRLSPEARSRLMARVRGKDTKPEMAVRRLLHSTGYRFRLHRRDLPGRPDIVLPARRKIILVHGCFWHRHTDCRYAVMPSTRVEWWSAKLNQNVERDRTAIAALKAAGWQVLVVWECEISRDLRALAANLRAFLGPPGTCGPTLPGGKKTPPTPRVSR